LLYLGRLVHCRVEVEALLCGPNNGFEHLRVTHAGKSRHFGQMAVPAPSGIRIYLQELRILISIQPPIEPGIIPTFEAFRKHGAPFDQGLLRLIRQVHGRGLDLPIGGIGAPLCFISANSWEMRRKRGIVLLGNWEHRVRTGRVPHDPNGEVLAREELFDQDGLLVPEIPADLQDRVDKSLCIVSHAP